MGCSPSTSVDNYDQIIQSERRMLSSQYSESCSFSESQAFKFQKKFSHGTSITDMKKEIVFPNQPGQIVEDEPIFHNIDSFIKFDSLNKTQSSKGILKSQNDTNAPKKKVSFNQNEVSDEDKTKKKKIKLRKSIFMR